MKPNKKNIKKWVKALRSGDFIQGHSYLESHVGGETKHCCLGVASRIAMENGVDLSTEESTRYINRQEGNKTVQVTEFNWETAFLPYSVSAWLGFDDRHILIRPGLPAIDANDDKHLTFAEIADSLEETYLKNWFTRLLGR